ncbi:sensor domain-containing diguanylate cyclase [Sphingomonas sp. ASV193]|uniref:sensor domain-containing diguanylate cyclase n=1 Tax=Sphingomonas sp. ASV193 TaxID=3144405 RepID=UPI0032E84E31
MIHDDKLLHDEAGRLAALDRYRLRSLDDGGGFQKITDLIADLFGASVCTVSLVDEDAQNIVAATGVSTGAGPRSEAVCDRTIRGRDVFVVPDLTADDRFRDSSFVTDDRHFRSYAGAPLTTPDGYNVGALCVIDRQPRSFSAEESYLLKRFAALVVEQMELRTIAHADFLTGAATRRAFSDRAGAVLRRSRGGGSPAALVVLDADHFKAINDRFGHGCGDKVLRAIVAALTEQLRHGDVVGRIGGEEFAVLLPDCDRDDARRCAERFRTAIASMQVEGLPLVTVSLGVASSDEADDVDGWLAAADEALYAAKRGGRNRTVMAGELPEAA